MKKIIVFGGSGFIGSSLIGFLSKTFQNHIIVSHDSTSCNLLNSDAVRGCVDEVDDGTSIVFLSAIKRQLGDSPRSLVDNVTMVGNLLAALEARTLDRFVFLSSTAVYGEDVHNVSIGMDTPPTPTSYYGIAKVAAEHALLKHFADLNQSDCLCILRPPTIFGVGEKRAGYGPARFVRCVARGETVTLWGDGSELREFIYVDDLSKLISDVLKYSYSGTANVVSGASVSFQGVLKEVEGVCGRALRTENRDRSKRKVDHCFRADSNPQFMMGRTFTPLRQALEVVYDYELNHES